MSLSATAQGCSLIETRRRLDQSEADWLVELAEFNEAELWRTDGHACAASWLVERCRLGRATAFEKVRVAREIRRRPALRDALRAGTASYSQVRVISRVTDGGDAFDDLMLANAERLTVDELEIAATHWDRLRNQDSPSPDFVDRRRIKRQRGFGGGMGRLIIDDWDENLDRIMNTLDASVDGNERAAQAAARHEAESPRETPKDPFDPQHIVDGDEPPPPSIAMKRLDALLDLVEVAVGVNPETIDVDRAAIGVTVAYEHLIAGSGSASLSRGGTVTGEAARRLACDAGLHRYIVRGNSEILDVGRQTRPFNRAMRRAIKARHGHKCAVKGCDRRILQIHHIIWWENGGHTSINNGVPLCHSHHHLVHEGGWTIAYNPTTGETRLSAPHRDPFATYASFDSAA